LAGAAFSIAIFAPLAVWIQGKFARQEPPADAGQLEMPIDQRAWRLAANAGAQLALYFGFGYLVAWQNPNLVSMYDTANHPQTFAAHCLLPFQILRGLLWVGFSVPVIRMAKGGKLETAILVALTLARPMNITHAIPNPFMPDPSVRLSHFIETTSSNFILGLLITWLLAGWHRSEGAFHARMLPI
jgi:hypothetical protein